MIKEIVKNLYLIERGWLNSNHFVLNCKNKVLIDTGYLKYTKTTLQLINETGLNPAETELIISTHSHSDHIGGNNTIQKLSGCDIAMHYIDKHHIDTKNDWFTWWRYYDQEAEYFRVTQSLTEGERIKLNGELELEVIHAPGHASGQISLYCPRHKFLISSDAIWEGDFGVLTPRIEGSISPFLQWETLEKLESLDIQVIYPGHGSPIYEPNKAFSEGKKRLDYFLNYPEKIGWDQIKKLILYILLIRPGFTKESLFDYLLNCSWFNDTVNLYFKGSSREIFEKVLDKLHKKGLLRYKNGELLEATLNP